MVRVPPFDFDDARLFRMSSSGRLIAALGGGSLIVAALLQLVKLANNNSGGFLDHLLDGFFNDGSICFVVLGLLVLLWALLIARRDRKLREFEEELKRANRS